jgi:hypothetical protein
MFEGGALTVASASALGSQLDAGVVFYGIPGRNTYFISDCCLYLL